MNPFDRGFFRTDELRGMGFRAVGEDVAVSRNCTIVGLANVSLGNHVRIDDYVVIAAAGGSLALGDHIHVGAGSYLQAGGGISLADFANLSQGVRIYSKSDDFSGAHLTNPTVPEEYLGVESAPVRLGKHCVVGSGSVILPGCELPEGVAVGALSLVLRSLEPWTVYACIPVRALRPRSREALALEQRMRSARGP